MKTMYILVAKEGGEKNTDIARNAITSSGLKIEKHRRVNLNDHIIGHLIPKYIPWQAYKMFATKLFGEEAEIGVVEGYDAINKLAKICNELRLKLILPTTIQVGRRKFKVHLIHYPKNKKQAKACLNLFDLLPSAKW